MGAGYEGEDPGRRKGVENVLKKIWEFLTWVNLK